MNESERAGKGLAKPAPDAEKATNRADKKGSAYQSAALTRSDYTLDDWKFAEYRIAEDLKNGITLDTQREFYWRRVADQMRRLAVRNGEDANVAGRDYDLVADLIHARAMDRAA